MQWQTTNAYKTLLARATLGEAVQLTPATLAVGSGGHDPGTGAPLTPSPTDAALASPQASAPLLSVTRSGFSITVTGLIPGGAVPLQLSEVGILTAGGVLIARGTFSPQIIATGVDARFTFTILPEV